MRGMESSDPSWSDLNLAPWPLPSASPTKIAGAGSVVNDSGGTVVCFGDSDTAKDETSIAFPQTTRDYFVLPGVGGTYTYGRFRDNSGVMDASLYPAMEFCSSLGVNTTTSLNLTLNTYYLVPFVPQRSNITRIVVPAGQAGDATMRIGIYTDLHTQGGGGIHYPGSLLYESSLTWYEGDPQTGANYMGGFTTAAAISVYVAPRTVHWMCFCYAYTTTAPYIHYIGVANLRPILGYIHRLRVSDSGTWLVGCMGLYYWVTGGGATVPGSAFPNPFTGTPASPPAASGSSSGLTYLYSGGTVDTLAREIAPVVLVGYGA